VSGSQNAAPRLHGFSKELLCFPVETFVLKSVPEVLRGNHCLISLRAGIPASLEHLAQ
jgi:hypothetical protein